VNAVILGSVVGTVVVVVIVAAVVLLSVIILYRQYHRTDSGEDTRKEIFVKSSFELHLPPYLIVPSSTIKLNETVGQGI
jgi:hypothetical protein